MTKALEIAQVPSFLDANTTALVVNANSYKIGSSFTANTTGVYTGVVNATSFSIGSNFIANTTAITTTSNTVTFGTSFYSLTNGFVGIGTTNTLGNATLNVLTGIAARTESPSGVTPYIQSYNGNATTDKKTWRIGGTSSGDLVIETVNDAYTSATARLYILSTGDFQFNSGYGSVATAYGCRAWVNFNGTGTVAIRASGNVTSITDNGTGDYTVNFTTAMPDANYATLFGGQQDDTSQALFMGLRLTNDTGTGAVVTTTSVRLLSAQAGTATDIYWANVAIFR